jgi:hypothetical protein
MKRKTVILYTVIYFLRTTFELFGQKLPSKTLQNELAAAVIASHRWVKSIRWICQNSLLCGLNFKVLADVTISQAHIVQEKGTLD